MWLIQDFSDGYVTIKGKGAKLLFGHFLPENCMKIEKLGKGLNKSTFILMRLVTSIVGLN